MIKDVSRRHAIGLGLGAAALSTLGRAQPADAGVGFAVVGLGKLSLGQIVPGFRNCRSARLTALVSGHPDKANRIAAEQKLPADAVYSYDDFDRIADRPADRGRLHRAAQLHARRIHDPGAEGRQARPVRKADGDHRRRR